MAFSQVTFLKTTCNHARPVFSLIRGFHGAATALPPSHGGAFDRTGIASPPMVLPEFDQSNPDTIHRNNTGSFGFSGFFSFGGSMELMAVPKRKTSPHKRGIRNGPKALKPQPVIIRCRSCGRVKLPHFYCCSGDKGKTGEQNS